MYLLWLLEVTLSCYLTALVVLVVQPIDVNTIMTSVESRSIGLTLVLSVLLILESVHGLWQDGSPLELHKR